MPVMPDGALFPDFDCVHVARKPSFGRQNIWDSFGRLCFQEERLMPGTKQDEITRIDHYKPC